MVELDFSLTDTSFKKGDIEMKRVDTEEELVMRKELYKLAKRFGVPPPAFYITNKKTTYDPETFEINLNVNATLQDLKHEFVHYLVHLIYNATEAEENLCSFMEEVL